MSGSGVGTPTALLIAAHGERTEQATNANAWRIVQALQEWNVAAEVTAGFINSQPDIGTSLRRLTAPRVLVYPLFASSGYFTRDRLVELLDQANDDGRDVVILPPLGLDPGFPDLVSETAAAAARAGGLYPEASALVLLAHGSRRSSASREATETVAAGVRAGGRFAEVAMAFLEERPFLDQAVADIVRPVVVVGIFSGEGLHGAQDAPRLIAELGRTDVCYAGVIGSAPGIDHLIARAIRDGGGRSLLARD